MKYFKVTILALLLISVSQRVQASSFTAMPSMAADFGSPEGGDKEKKEKKEKGDKKEKDESTKDAKTNGESTKPSQHARLSAKGAKQAQKLAKQEVMARAKVRMFFHNMFNTKYGKPVNFRNTRARNHWSKGSRRHR